jgi:O-methyltransferase involved in polyketide biosynthesis
MEVVNNMLLFVKEISCSGSSICFDYAALSDKALNERNAKELRDHMRSQYANEPTKFGIKTGEIGLFLAEKGFEVVEHLTADEMTKRFLPSDSHLDIGKIPSLFCLVQANVK